MSATRTNDCTMSPSTLYLAFELGERTWKLGFSTGLGRPPRLREITARDMEALQHEVSAAKWRFGLRAQTPVLSCYEAGREGFWLHRWLLSQGVENQVVDSASIEVKRRKRRVKTDRMDAAKLLKLLVRWRQGERDAWSVVRVPSVEEEDARQLHRELEALRAEQTAHSNCIQGLLATHGITLPVDRRFPKRLSGVRQWDGRPLPTDLYRRLLREFERMQVVNRQVRELEQERARRIRKEDRSPAVQQVRQLMQLSAIADNSAWLFVHEIFAWRKIKNRRELGALVGLVGSPYQSGDVEHDQGISKSGNRRMRAMAIEIAWCWVRFQPQSALSQWYLQRFARGGKRMRRIGIVALARKLLVGLWRYLETGVPPAGAEVSDWRKKIHYTLCLAG